MYLITIISLIHNMPNIHNKPNISEVMGKKTKLFHFAGLLQTDEHIIRASAIYFEWVTFLVTQLIILDVNDKSK